MIKKAKNIFVFSDYAFNLASSILNTRNNIYRLNLPIYIQDGIANNSTDTINISILGFISRYKKLDLIFESLVNLDKHITYPVQVNITGHVMERILFKKPKGKYRVDSIEKKIERMKNIKIIYHGYVEDSYLREMYLKTDIGIALRSTEDYYGESSRTTIEHMSFGIPMILNDIGFFKELPSEYVYKVKNEHPNDLAKILLRAIVDLKQNRINKNNIKNYIKENHSVKKFSEDILKVYQ
jgi:glycosyltransferase involved in cell wall biosynthesis